MLLMNQNCLFPAFCYKHVLLCFSVFKFLHQNLHSTLGWKAPCYLYKQLGPGWQQRRISYSKVDDILCCSLVVFGSHEECREKLLKEKWSLRFRINQRSVFGFLSFYILVFSCICENSVSTNLENISVNSLPWLE